MPAEEPTAMAAPPRRGIVRRLFGWLFKGVFWFVVVSVLWVLLYRFVNPPITFTQLGDLIGGNGVTRRMAADRRDRPQHGPRGDRRRGRALLHPLRLRSPTRSRRRCGATPSGRGVIRGGSTISQQTAKNAFLWQGGGWFRKALEAWFTLLIELLWSKERIMEVYLNVAETGIGTYGAEAGAIRYFNHGADRLSVQEAARIAAVLPLPKRREAIDPGRLHPPLRQRHRGADARRRPRRPRRLRLSVIQKT